MYYNKLVFSFTVFLCILFSGCGVRHQRKNLIPLSRTTAEHVVETSDCILLTKKFSKNDCEWLFAGSNPLHYKIQPIHITLINNSDKTYSIDFAQATNHSLVHPDAVFELIRSNTNEMRMVKSVFLLPSAAVIALTTVAIGVAAFPSPLNPFTYLMIPLMAIPLSTTVVIFWFTDTFGESSIEVMNHNNMVLESTLASYAFTKNISVGPKEKLNKLIFIFQADLSRCPLDFSYTCETNNIIMSNILAA